MTDLTSGPADATPLTEDERKSLTLPVLARDELNRAEAENISLAMSWLFFSQRRLQPASVTREPWLRGLHRRMYSHVWS
jgi:fido (protein-threonine AMPylation protein)